MHKSFILFIMMFPLNISLKEFVIYFKHMSLFYCVSIYQYFDYYFCLYLNMLKTMHWDISIWLWIHGIEWAACHYCSNRSLLHDYYYSPHLSSWRCSCWASRNWQNWNYKRPCQIYGIALCCIQLRRWTWLQGILAF